MLFNSYVFILAFLPITVLVFFLAGASDRRYAAIAWLVIASLFFYAWWNPPYVVLISASIVFNYGVAMALGRKRQRSVLAMGVAANLLLLGYFKYANFFINNVNAVLGTSFILGDIFLPLGISFFTFQQIAYLVDTYRGETRENNFLHYCLFVTFFPQLIAGPIVHHKEILPQFRNRAIYRPAAKEIGFGLSIFFLGLFKKSVLADSAALFSSPVFEAAANGLNVPFFDAWGGALAYSFQLYFDFSGYSDMAVGLGRMFGIRIPLNFNSPYKALNVIDFWRRWHMTLSQFLRDYLYIPLGGNRYGQFRRHANLFLTMLLGGLWHGAGWTFVLWGALHGVCLIVNHLWHRLQDGLGIPKLDGGVGRILARGVTFLVVLFGWILFRSDNLTTAGNMIAGFCGRHGFEIPSYYLTNHPALSEMLGSWVTATSASGFLFGSARWLLVCLVVCGGIAFLMPNTQEFMGMADTSRNARSIRLRSVLRWRPSLAMAILLAMVGAAALFMTHRESEFLYFQF